MTCQRATDARKLLDAAEVFDSYGWTLTAAAAVECAQDVLDRRINPAPKAQP